MIKFMPILIIFTLVAIRLLPHPANFVPIGALALFGGSYLPKKYALTIPFAVMFVSDMFLGFHSTMPYIYGSFILISLIGITLKNRVNFTNVLLASLSSSILFYLITNLGVFISTNLYPKTATGLLDCFIMAIPFFRNTLLGDLFYNGMFFGSFALVKQLYFKLAYQSN
ncbi:MAG: DUF6580 family putative transport protein [Microgenomates group bacterium]